MRDSRVDLPPVVSVFLVSLALLGLGRMLPALAALRMPELRGQLSEHLGAGIAPLWVHLVVVVAMTVATVILVWSDECSAALFALVGAMYAAEPLQAVGGAEVAVEKLLVPLVVSLAILKPRLPSRWLAWPLGGLLVVSLGLAGLVWSDIADDAGAAPWGNELFYVGDALLFPIGALAMFVLVIRSGRPLSLKALSLWGGFGPYSLFFTCALFWPALQDLLLERGAIITIVLLLAIAPVGVVVASYRHD